MKIGIGVISYLRPQHLDHWKSQIEKFCDFEYELSIYIDEPKRMGIAYGKNQNLKDLAHCDYNFLFDSDCFPIKSGWADYFIEASKQSGQQHFQLQIPSNETKVVAVAIDKELNDSIPVNIFDNTNGCMMFMTKRCIDMVGAYDESFGIYGHEHAQYTQRIHRAGLTPFGACSTPKDAEKYIYSLDLMPWSDLHKKLNHKGSMNSKEALKYVSVSAPIYQKESPIYIPL